MIDPTTDRDATGIHGLDDILAGGFPKHRLYLVRGTPGTGKTTLSLQFLREGVRTGERVLYITLSETQEEIRQVASSHGWSLDGMDIFELSAADGELHLDDENTLYATEDVDLREIMSVLLARVASVNPTRVVFDSLSEIRMLAQSTSRYRRQLLALKKFFTGKKCSVLLLDDRTGVDFEVDSLAHGVLTLEQVPLTYGADRRRLRVVKLRGSTFRSGYHDFTVRKGGLEAFPRMIAAEHRSDFEAEAMSSGVAGLDALLGGGIDRATCTLIMGPAGTGKSIIATQFAAAAAARGEPATIFLFEERVGTWRTRSQKLGLPIDDLIAAGRLHVQQIDPAELAPDEFTNRVRQAIEKDGSRVVVIDSIAGYFTAMPEAHALSLQMHELLSYLSERGVASVMTMAQTGLVGAHMVSPVDVSYLADAVILLRYFENAGKLRKTVSVLKKRSGVHEQTIRELSFDERGILVGPPLDNFHGILSGAPVVVEASAERALQHP